MVVSSVRPSVGPPRSAIWMLTLCNRASLDTQRNRQRITEDAVIVLGLGVQRVGAGRQADREGQGPVTQPIRGAVAQNLLAAAAVDVVEGHLRDGAVRVAIA